MTITDLLLQVEVSDLVANWGSLLMVALKFLLNLVIVILIVRLGYARGQNKSEFLFTYFIFNVLIFFLCYLMTQVNLSLGFAFGLFALFSIMRYRTMTIEIREMTYLFVVVSLGVLNSVTGAGTPIVEIVLINVTIFLTVLLAERAFLKKAVRSAIIRFERIELVRLDNFPALKADFENRLGAEILSIEVMMLNYLTDSAELEVTNLPVKPSLILPTRGKGKPQPEEKTIPEEIAS